MRESNKLAVIYCGFRGVKNTTRFIVLELKLLSMYPLISSSNFDLEPEFCEIKLFKSIDRYNIFYKILLSLLLSKWVVKILYIYIIITS
jgi:hypothetical protein